MSPPNPQQGPGYGVSSGARGLIAMGRSDSRAATLPRSGQAPMRAGPVRLERLLDARADLWRGQSKAAAVAQGIATGFPLLDRALPWSGWPADGLIELLTDQPGAALALMLPALVRLCATADARHDDQGARCVTPDKHPSRGGRGHQRESGGDSWLLLVNPPLIPYAPALAAYGLDPEHVVLVDAPEQGAWAMEQGLRLGGCAAVIGWAGETLARGKRARLWTTPILRRLQLAAKERSTPAFLVRASSASVDASPAPLRLDVESIPDGLGLMLRKLRGGRAGTRLRLSAPMRSASLGMA